MRYWLVECIPWIGLLGFIVAALCAGYALESVSCHAKWGKSGMPVAYGLVSGCMVQQADGGWIPADSYRGILN